MSKRELYLTIVFISLLILSPLLIKIFKDGFTVPWIIRKNIVVTAIKFMIYADSPEWREVEFGLEQLIPDSSASVFLFRGGTKLNRFKYNLA